METSQAKTVPITERLRNIKIGSYTVDHGSHTKHIAVRAICEEAAAEIDAAKLELEAAVKEAIDLEREACAKLCEAMACLTYDEGTTERRAWNEATIDCAETIRMRSNAKVGADKGEKE